MFDMHFKGLEKARSKAHRLIIEEVWMGYMREEYPSFHLPNLFTVPPPLAPCRSAWLIEDLSSVN